MRAQKSSKTAEIVAAFRASHTRYDGGTIFSDPFAELFISRTSKRLIQTARRDKLLMRGLGAPALPLMAAVIVRGRYTEDQLSQAIANGTQQYVVLGAGFDSFALRRAADFPDLQIFELDHPATQAMKQQKLADANITLPSNHHFVSIDFEQQNIAEVLANSAFNPQQPSFWAWLGVTHYLQPATIQHTLNTIAQFSPATLDLVLDYSLPDKLLPWYESLGGKLARMGVALLGEPVVGQLAPKTLHTMAAKSGWSVVEDVDRAAQIQRYRGHWPKRVRPPEAIHLLHLNRAAL